MIKKLLIFLMLLSCLTISAIAQNQLKGEWLLVSMTDKNGAEISMPEEFTISMNFSGADVRIISCNSISGKYSAYKKTIKITLLRTTAMPCRELEKELSFNNLLKTVNNYSVKNNELILSGKTQKPIIKFLKTTENKRIKLNGKRQLVSMVVEKDMAVVITKRKFFTVEIDG